MNKQMSGYKTDNWIFKPHKREIIFNGDKKVIKLPNKVSNLLEILCKSKNKFVDRNEIFDALWDGNYSVGDRGLRQVVFQLRKVLSIPENNTNPVINIPRKGYKLNEFVEAAELSLRPNKNDKRILSLLITFCVIFAIYIFYFFQPNQITIEAIPVTTEGGLEEAFAISPDGESFLYNKYVEGHFRIFKRDILDEQTTDELFIPMEGTLGGMIWNHTGDKVAYLKSTGKQYYSEIYIYDLKSQDSRYIADQVSINISQSPYGIAWSPIEDKLSFTSHNDGNQLALFIYDVQTDRIEQLTNPDYIDTFPQWSLDGKIITYSLLNRNYKSDLYSIDLSSNLVTNLTDSNLQIYGHTWIDDDHIIFSTKENGDFVSKLLNYQTKQITPIKLQGNFQFPQLSGSEIYYLRSNQEFQLKTYRVQNKTLVFEDLIDSIGKDHKPVLHSTSQKMAFISDRTGWQELWYKKNENHKPVQITFKQSYITAPSFSQDGSKILYHWFNTNTNELQLGVYDLDKLTEIPINVINSRKGLFAGGNNVIAYLRVTEEDRQLWTYDIKQNQKQKISDGIVTVVGSNPSKNEVYFDEPNTYFSYNILTGVTKRLEDKRIFKSPVLLQDESIFHVVKKDTGFFLADYNVFTKREHIMFKLDPELSNNLFSFAVGNHKENVVLNLYSKNEGDIYKFSKDLLLN